LLWTDADSKYTLLNRTTVATKRDQGTEQCAENAAFYVKKKNVCGRVEDGSRRNLGSTLCLMSMFIKLTNRKPKHIK
jgi:hypothetical protein